MNQKLETTTGRIMTFALCGLIFFLPISIALVEFFFTVGMATFWVKRFILTFWMFRKEASFGSPIESSLAKRLWKIYRPIPTPANRALGCFILAGILSLFASHYLNQSIKGFFGKLIEATFIYFIFVEAINSPKRLKVFLSVFSFSAILVLIDGFYQYATGFDMFWHNELSGGRISAGFRHPNDLGGYLVVILPLWLSAVFASFWRTNTGALLKMSKGIVMALQLTSLVLFLSGVEILGLTYSRSAWIAFFVGLMVLGLSSFNRAMSMLGLVVAFIVLFSPGLLETRKLKLLDDRLSAAERLKAEYLRGEGQYTAESYEEKIKSLQSEIPEPKPIEQPQPFALRIKGFLKDYSGSGRSLYWRDALSIIRQSPIIGNGINTYSLVAKELKVEWGGYPHNCYLQMTAELGIFGLCMFFWIALAIFYSSLRTLMAVIDPFLQTVLLGSLSGVVAFLVQSALDTNFYSVQLGNLLWVGMGLVMATQRIAQQER